MDTPPLPKEKSNDNHPIQRTQRRTSTFRLLEPDNDHNSLPKKIILWLLQIFGIVAALVFGTFSVLAWQNSEKAAQQADVANLVAFLSFCGDLAASPAGGNMVSLKNLRGGCLRGSFVATGALSLASDRH